MRLRIYLIILGGIVILGGMVYGLDAIRWFRIADVSVTGNKLLSADEVKENALGTLAARLGAWSLLGDDHVLFWLAARGTERLDTPLLTSATIRVNVRARSADISVTERRLAGIVCTDACYAFDGDGVVFAKAPQAEGQLFLVVTGNAATDVRRGETVFDAGEIRRFREALAAFTENDIPVKAVRLRDEALKEWEAVLENGTVVYFDRMFIPDDLGGIMAALSARADFNALSYIDFRVPNRIYFR